MTVRQPRKASNDRLCPACTTRSGILTSLAVGQGAVLLGLSCPSCGHAWQTEAPAPDSRQQLTARGQVLQFKT